MVPGQLIVGCVSKHETSRRDLLNCRIAAGAVVDLNPAVTLDSGAVRQQQLLSDSTGHLGPRCDIGRCVRRVDRRRHPAGPDAYDEHSRSEMHKQT